MAIMTALQGQHDLIQFMKNPKVRERHFIDNPPDDKTGQESADAKDAPQVRPADKDL